MNPHLANWTTEYIQFNIEQYDKRRGEGFYLSQTAETQYTRLCEELLSRKVLKSN